ncbi:DEKNAAC104616 [Brettanomyces naardenensis]|uniref:DEKNAAC104616 n=1 Tax=Brettanomyces naardenensis TaxID=13370 RepID=A0A448YRR9_BRENA|nr:DEKNAAC104616 [Brettanomyces naardenensis]
MSRFSKVSIQIPENIQVLLPQGLLDKEMIPVLGMSLLALIVATAVIGSVFNARCKTVLMFCWNCFVKPFMPSSVRRSRSAAQQQALEAFYETQAKIYDTTRSTLLKGREDSLKLAISHLSKTKNLVWVDVGGGTGFNIEQMDSIFPLMKHFKAIYIVDLSPSLLTVAKERFDAMGLTNVHCLLADACTFTIPYSSADLITFSYSLSMIPTFHSAIDHAALLLHKEGLICCVDFGVQSEVTTIGRVNTVGGMSGRHIPWILRTFWRTWFEADRVFLDPARRDYLEYRFGTVKSLNLYNRTLGDIPYYIWLGCDKDRSPSLLYRVNALATESPYLAPQDVPKGELEELKTSKGHEAAIQNESRNLPYPSMYYQRDIYRVYYDEQRPEYNQFNNQYIYAFTWEDPREDDSILHFTKEDSILAITSAGDNILSYASLPNAPSRIHCVDLNPCQGHLLELKLAAIKSLTREETWKMFGLGKIENFNELLIKKMAPHMSSNAFQYWFNLGPKTFGTNGRGLYYTGFSKWALRLARYVFKLTGTSGYVDELCKATTMEQQRKIWKTKLRPKLLNPVISKLLIGNPIFLWKALGVPANQASMMGSSVIKYLEDTLDPVVDRYMISNENYFYYLCLQGKYSKNNCPDYLTKEAHDRFNSKDSPLDNIRIHTDFLNDVFGRLTKKSLTIAIIMDHMDWFAEEGTDADDEISALYQSLAPGGRVLLRSASKCPWYIRNFEKFGFKCEAAAVRESGTAIDRVNMYSSTWVCHKAGKKRNMSTLEL